MTDDRSKSNVPVFTESPDGDESFIFVHDWGPYETSPDRYEVQAHFGGETWAGNTSDAEELARCYIREFAKREIEAARREGYEQGRKDGYAECTADALVRMQEGQPWFDSHYRTHYDLVMMDVESGEHVGAAKESKP